MLISFAHLGPQVSTVLTPVSGPVPLRFVLSDPVESWGLEVWEGPFRSPVVLNSLCPFSPRLRRSTRIRGSPGYTPLVSSLVMGTRSIPFLSRWGSRFSFSSWVGSFYPMTPEWVPLIFTLRVFGNKVLSSQRLGVGRRG